jgi:hypothetical protein
LEAAVIVYSGIGPLAFAPALIVVAIVLPFAALDRLHGPSPERDVLRGVGLRRVLGGGAGEKMG